MTIFTSRFTAGATALVIGFLTIGSASAQTASDTLTWVSGNSSNNHVSELDWSQLQSFLLNTDSSAYSSLVSFAFRTNTCSADDVGTEIIAADTNRDWLTIYTDADNYAVGTVFCDSSVSGCPASPEGLSIGTGGTLAVVSTGQGNSTPSITLLDDAGCPEPGGAVDPSKPYPYENPRSTGPICFGSDGTCDFYPDRITDSAFVKVPGGGLTIGDLIVIGNPGTVAYIPAEDLPPADQRKAPRVTVANILADTAALGGDVTSGAWVTATGGAGAAGTDSETEDFVVTVTGGIVKVLRWRKDGNGDPILIDNPAPALFSSPLGNGPLGITAGVLGDKTYLGLARRNQGTLNRCELDVEFGRIVGIGGDDIAACDSIQDAQSPQDIIINTDVLNAEDCDTDAADGDGQIGCEFNRTVRVIYTQDTTANQEVAADIRVLEVPCDLRPPLSFADLGLPGDYSVPYHTWPIPLGDDGSCIYVYADFEDDIDITAGNWIWSDVLLSDLFDELGPCWQERFEQVYHPNRNSDPADQIPYGDLGVLYPIDVVCQNPPGGLKREFSPSIFGKSSFLARLDDGSRSALRNIDKDIKDEAARRYSALIDIVESSNLEATPQAAILAALSPAGNSIKKKEFATASDQVDAAIVNAIASENPGAFTAAGVRSTLYGDVLGLALNLSYFLWDVGNYPGRYCPPIDLSNVGVTCTGKTP